MTINGDEGSSLVRGSTEAVSVAQQLMHLTEQIMACPHQTDDTGRCSKCSVYLYET